MPRDNKREKQREAEEERRKKQEEERKEEGDEDKEEGRDGEDVTMDVPGPPVEAAGVGSGDGGWDWPNATTSVWVGSALLSAASK